ncbi:TPA: hypothetical protein QDC20_000273 [Burkholderia aenigmatica]|uniref:hypothetical protein n=1 Tax=Burkholderia sp. AU45251 TaxID=3059204 RepID=UPI00264D98C9|nr:hypothetical protein [Burkholderia sp. AU45251]HDR9483174.1 hypothetical protein [Burkholderia aenigmatica]MDN7516039.1 hypothetical protein [Burkholderia sp. AU45251]HDR9514122.1 hypothetical protein [Burkholderia aenigmatica]HDR9591512.1 hypothetical protein [Burkholderia aenigmatica]HDR9598604.1 hypothetical protein [Burkholderia aenigmatica]
MKEIVKPHPPQIAPTKLPVRHPARVWLRQTARLCRMRARMPATAQASGTSRRARADAGAGRDGTARMKGQKNAAPSQRLCEQEGR